MFKKSRIKPLPSVIYIREKGDVIKQLAANGRNTYGTSHFSIYGHGQISHHTNQMSIVEEP